MKQRLSFRIISMLIVISICISMLPASALAVDDNFFAVSTDENMLETEMVEAHLGIDKNSVPEIIGHEEALRRNHVGRLYDEEGEDLNKVIFLNKDGSKTMYLFDFPVKYIDENGIIKDISLQIEDAENKNGDFKTADNSAITTFSAKLSDGIRLKDSNTNIQLVPVLSSDNQNVLSVANTSTSLVTDSNATRVNDNTIEYQYDDKTTIEYSLTYTGFKEDIVVSEYTGQTTYPFYLYTNGLKLKEIENSYYLVDDTDNIKATIGDIIIFTADERNNAFGDIVPTTIIEGEEYLLNIVVGADYLADPDTVYPIRIDPTIEINYDSSGSAAIEDITITTNTNYNGSHTSLYVGRRSTEGIARALMRFPGLNLSSLSNITITSAGVRVRDLMCEDTPLDVSCHVFTGNVWDANSATWSSVNPDSYVSAPLSTNTLSWSIGDSFNPIHWYYFDIKAAVEGWISDAYAQNKGIVFKVASSVENGSTIANRTFGSYNRASYKPSFSMTYFDGTSSIALSTTSCSIQEGNTRTLVATTNPANQTVTWSTSNSAVATVSSTGVVTANKAGTATITARIVDPNGVTRTATCTVYVYIANGVYHIKNLNSNYYLHVKNGNIANCSDVHQYSKYSDSANNNYRIRQMWKIYYLGEGRYSVRPLNKLDMGLDVTDGNVDIFDIGTSDTLSSVPFYGEWAINWYSTGYVFKNNGSDSETMQIENASTSSGATVVASAYSTSVNCRWGLIKVSSPPSGAYLYDTANESIVSTATRDIYVGSTKSLSTLNLSAVAYSGSNISQSFTWSSSNSNIATVNSSGSVTGVSSGKATITGYVYRNGAYYYVRYTICVGASFQTTMTKLDELYDTALEYNSTPRNAALLTMQFIRRMKYNSSSWTTVAGAIDSQFVNYVQTNYPSLYDYFTVGSTENYYYLDPNGEGYVDFTHLCATMNGLLYDSEGFKAAVAGEANINNLCGWAGDLQTLCIEVLDYTNNSNDYETVYSATYNMIGDEAHSLSMMDLLADTDAYNVYKLLNSSTSNFMSSFTTYYDDYVGTRYTRFTNGWPKQTIYNCVRNYTTNTFFLWEDWPLLEGYEITNTQSNAIASAFTDFIWEKIQNE